MYAWGHVRLSQYPWFEFKLPLFYVQDEKGNGFGREGGVGGPERLESAGMVLGWDGLGEGKE